MRQRSTYRCIGVREAQAFLGRRDVLLLDVRDANSFDMAHIAGAKHLSGGNLSDVINTAARSAPVLIYCYHGNASREYAQIFGDFGFADVYGLDGGYEAWRTRLPPQGGPFLDEALQQWLVEGGFLPADVNAVVQNGTTPLMRASHKGDGAAVRMLIAAGAQLDARDADGNNALWLACVGKHLDIIDMLIDAGVDIGNRNDNGATPLMYAASSGNAAVVDRLLVHGADIGSETLDGFTALDLASTVECLALLWRATDARNVAEAFGTQVQVPHFGS
jgi:rhodanese-related sulfurtransferase